MRWKQRIVIGILVLLAHVAFAAPTVVQSTQCTTTTSPLTCTFGSAVTAGDYVFTMVAGGNTFAVNSPDCKTGSGAYSDTLGTAYVRVIGENNVNGFGSGVCIMWAQLSSSGSDAVSYAFGGTPGAMVMYAIEVSGLPGTSLDATGHATDNLNTTVSVSATASTASSFIVCAASNNNASTYTSGTPGTFTAIGSTGGFLHATGGSGLTTCTFNLSGGGNREAMVIGIVKYGGTASKRRRSQVY